MMSIRTLRAVLATAATWSVAWVPFALVPLGMVAASGQGVPLRLAIRVVMTQATLGAIGGALFAAALTLGSQTKRFDELRIVPVGLWGAIGGLLLPLVVQLVMRPDVGLPLVAVAAATASSAVLGATCASVTLWIARRAPEQIYDRDDNRLTSGAA